MSKKLSIEIFQKIAEDKGGKLITREYVNIRTPMEWECAEGHRWRAIAHSVRNLNTWCPQCAIHAKLDIEDLKQLAIERGGKLISEEYINSKTPMLWECAEGHRWRANGNSIKSHGTWCPHCLGQAKLDIEDLKQLAIERGGKLISEEYVNIKTHMLWECEKLHRWSAAAQDVKNGGTWCPQCQTGKSENLFRDTIEKNDWRKISWLLA